MKTISKITCVICILSVSFSVCIAGSLQPTSAPEPTMKTLDEVEPRIPISSIPFTISNSGSYYLTQNLSSDSNGIIIESNDVTIDLCGFTMSGTGAESKYGIHIKSKDNIELRNGTIKNFGYSAIYSLLSPAGKNVRVIAVKALSNGIKGIVVNNHGSLIKDCIASGNGPSASVSIQGIYAAGFGSKIIANSVDNNGSAAAQSVYGIYAGNGSTVSGNTVYNNGNLSGGSVYGVNGIYVLSGSRVSGNTVYSNGGQANNVTGITTYTTGCIVTDNAIYGNGISAAGDKYGIKLGDHIFVDRNVLYNNGTSIIQTGTDNLITENNILP